jgi:adenine/guanine phosphoribosyltransferase-like PRPP-binding protein
MAHSYYLESLFYPKILSIKASQLSDAINLDKKELDLKAIAVRGMSGCLIAGLISVLTDLPIILVRKPKEESHSYMNVEYIESLNAFSASYCIVDDLIGSGNTCRLIEDAVRKELPDLSLRKIYLYNSDRIVPLSVNGKEVDVQSFG